MATYADMVEGVEPWFFKVLPIEFCLQFRLIPVRVDDQEIHVLGRAPFDPNVLLYIQRISARAAVPIPVDADMEDSLVGFLSVACRRPEVLETTERPEGELLSMIKNPPVWGPTCWEKLRSVNLALAGRPGDAEERKWVSVLSPGVLAVHSWRAGSRSGLEGRLRVDADTTAQVRLEGGAWVVSLCAAGEDVQSMQFTTPFRPDWPGDEGMGFGSSSSWSVASFPEKGDADAFAGELGALLTAVRQDARVLGVPPRLWL